MTLEPLELSHHDELVNAASDGKLWELSHITTVPRPEEAQAYIERALTLTKSGEQQAFAVRRNSDGKIVGTTRFYEIMAKDRRRAIGWTWYAKSAQRTVVNTAAKSLLLTCAFEELECISVAFHTHANNVASRTAILRLGAKEEGTLRNHRIMRNGSFRDTVCFSIIESEWEEVSTRLEKLLLSYHEKVT